MAALSTNYHRPHKRHTPALNIAPADAGKVFWEGAYICREAATGLVIPASDTANLVPLGVVQRSPHPENPLSSAALDNSSGADGVLDHTQAVRVVQYDQAGEWAFNVTAGTPRVGGSAFLVNDHEVSANATTNSIKAGTFTRPVEGMSGHWYVDISRRG